MTHWTETEWELRFAFIMAFVALFYINKIAQILLLLLHAKRGERDDDPKVPSLDRVWFFIIGWILLQAFMSNFSGH